MELFRALHSISRWAVVIVAIAVIVYMLVGLLQKKPYTKQANTLMSIFGGLVGLQWILGIVLLVVGGYFAMRHAWEHAFMMTLALVAAHAYVRFKRMNLPAARHYSYNLLAVLATFGLIFVGLLPLMNLIPNVLTRVYTGG